MNRNHIHLAQGIPGETVISGIRKSSDVLIYIDINKALANGIRFYLSDNGVVLTEGNKDGFLECDFFQKVVKVGSRTPPRILWERSSMACTAGRLVSSAK